MMLVPLFDLKSLNELAGVPQEIQIGGTKAHPIKLNRCLSKRNQDAL